MIDNVGLVAHIIFLLTNRKLELFLSVFLPSYDISKEKTRKRELRGLMAASAETGCNNLYLITDFERESLTMEGKPIEIIPAYDWLIEK